MPDTTPPEPTEDLGNTIDGTGTGDGSTTRPVSDDESPERAPYTAGHGSPAPGPDGSPDAGHHSDPETREEQKRVYQTPEQTDHALGGSEGTADGS